MLETSAGRRIVSFLLSSAVPFAAAFVLVAATASMAAQGDCGQPVGTGQSPTASDALAVLRAAVAIDSCEPCVCDADGSGSITASDALRVLRNAIGQGVSLECPPCTTTGCVDAQAPSCAGACPQGQVCGPNALDPGVCDCLNECEQGAAPECGGSCGPTGLMCSPATFGGDAGESNACVCIPANLQVCVDAAAPGCFGLCTPGSFCDVDGEGGCTCTTLPQQGTCSAAEPPTCGGTCPVDTVCSPNESGCECVPDAEGEESCFDVEAPMCTAGSCTVGRLCSTSFLGDCDCLEPCEVSEAPACSGECSDPSKSCARRTLSTGGSVLEFCDCLVAP